MDGSKDGRAHRTLHPQLMHETTVHTTGIVRIGIFGLLRESISIEPRKKFEIERQAHVTVLRRMDMQVIEGRNEEFVSKIHHLSSPVHILG